MNTDELSRIWRERSLRYVSGINRFVERGLSEGWENVGHEPEDDRADLAIPVLAALRSANEAGNLAGFRERFPPAHSPFLQLLEANGQSISPISIVDGDRIVARLGAPYENGRIVILQGDSALPFAGAFIFGRSRDRRVFAFASEDGVHTRDGWDGPVLERFPFPKGSEGVPSGYDAELLEGTPVVETLVPFADGKRVLFVGPDGVFILSPEAAHRLLPTEADLREHFEWLRTEHPEDPLSMSLDMVHATVSKNGRFVAAGSQDSNHLVFKDGSLFASVGNLSEYPHHACFSSDDSVLAFNSCHFYHGETVGVPIAELKQGFESEPYEVNEPVFELESGSRVYAAAHRGDEFIFGDASGYLRAVSNTGEPRWQQFIGSSVGDIDVTPDGKTLAVSTYAGFLCVLDLDTGDADPFVIGTSTHKEKRRWVFWRGEKEPLIW
ncbi:MAG: hypothetical protein AAF219_11315 [Myxococcota bacterium]